MMEQNWQNDPVKSPEIQEIILVIVLVSLLPNFQNKLEITQSECYCKLLYGKQDLRWIAWQGKQGFISEFISRWEFMQSIK